MLDEPVPEAASTKSVFNIWGRARVSVPVVPFVRRSELLPE